MSSNYPNGLDDFINPDENDFLTSPNHALQHRNMNAAILSIQGELGINPSSTWSNVASRLNFIDQNSSAVVYVGNDCQFDPADYTHDEDAFYDAAASLEFGGTIVAKRGTYEFAKRGFDMPANINLQGEGDATIIAWKDNGSSELLSNTLGANWLVTLNGFSYVHNVRLLGYSTWTCPINGVDTQIARGTNTRGGGLRIKAPRCRVGYVHIEGMAEGGYLNDHSANAHAPQVNSLRVLACGGIGVDIHAFAFDGEYNMIWVGSCGAGVRLLNGATSINILHSWGNQGTGLDFDSGSHGSRIQNAYIETNGKYGVYWNNALRTTINTLDLWGNNLDGTSSGIKLQDSRFNSIENFIARDNRGVTIVLRGDSKYNSIENGRIVDTYAYDQNTLAFNTTPVNTANGSDIVTATSGTPFTAGHLNCYITIPNVVTNALIIEKVDSTHLRVEAPLTVTATAAAAHIHTVYAVVWEAQNGSTIDTDACPNYYRNLDCRQYASSQMYVNPSSSVTNCPGLNARGTTIVASTSGGGITIDRRRGDRFDFTLTSDVTASFFGGSSNIPGTDATIILRQDAVGNRSVTWPATPSFIWGTGATPSFIKTPNSVTVVKTEFDGTKWIGVTSIPSTGSGSGAVSSVAGRTGAVLLSNTDISGLGTSATLNVAASGNAASDEVVKGNDSRLTDSRTPLRRVATLTDAATVTPNADTTDIGVLASVSQTTTIANPTGTPVDCQTLMLRIISSSSRTLNFGSKYRAGPIALPTSTTGSSKVDYLGFQYVLAADKWDLLASSVGY